MEFTIENKKWEIGASWLEGEAEAYSIASGATVTIKNNSFEIPLIIGKGYVKYHEIEAGICCLIHDIIFTADVIFLDKALQKNELFLFQIDTSISKAHFITDSKLLTIGENFKHSCVFTSSGVEVEYHVPGNSNHRGILVLMTKKWLLDIFEIIDFPEKEVWINDISDNGRMLYAEGIETGQFELANELFQPEYAGFQELLLRINVLKIFIRFLIRATSMETDNLAGVYVNDIEKILLIRDRLTTDFSKQLLPINEVAKELNMSSSKFRALFKEVCGETYFKYYQDRRMYRVKDLMTEGKYSISEIGYRCGFSNMGHLSKLFKRYYGVLPSKFKQIPEEK